MMRFLSILFLLLVVGCSKPVEIPNSVDTVLVKNVELKSLNNGWMIVEVTADDGNKRWYRTLRITNFQFINGKRHKIEHQGGQLIDVVPE